MVLRTYPVRPCSLSVSAMAVACSAPADVSTISSTDSPAARASSLRYIGACASVRKANPIAPSALSTASNCSSKPFNDIRCSRLAPPDSDSSSRSTSRCSVKLLLAACARLSKRASDAANKASISESMSRSISAHMRNSMGIDAAITAALSAISRIRTVKRRSPPNSASGSRCWISTTAK